MNRNLDGTLLTTADLRKIAADHGLGDKADALNALHNTNLIHSGLISLTKDVRFSMFCKGLLTLNTRND